jgi:mannose/cellobiose epimerase-like protein (N-acyl-D-glucosamine 2-epimerase family)
VCTSFVGIALVEAYEERGDARCLDMAVSSAEYLLKELYWDHADGTAGFAYPLPSVRNQVHNANFLAAEVLSRVYRYTGEKKFLAPALKAARYSASQQRTDGSWTYGEAATQQWIDNFHTGFNLSSLRRIGMNVDTSEFESHVRLGLEFYNSHFFREDGAVRYFHNQIYPIDTHCVAQSVITLLDLKDLNPNNAALANSVLEWALDHMWDGRRGFFYYRILRSCTIRTSYMRWTQAWMFLALAKLLLENSSAGQPQEWYQKASYRNSHATQFIHHHHPGA